MALSLASRNSYILQRMHAPVRNVYKRLASTRVKRVKVHVYRNKKNTPSVIYTHKWDVSHQSVGNCMMAV